MVIFFGGAGLMNSIVTPKAAATMSSGGPAATQKSRRTMRRAFGGSHSPAIAGAQYMRGGGTEGAAPPRQVANPQSTKRVKDITMSTPPRHFGRFAGLMVVMAVGLFSAPTLASGGATVPGTRAYPLDVHRFAVLERDSGPVSYYSLVEDPAAPFIRGVYQPPLQTVTLFADVGDNLRTGVERIRFRWRPWVLPVDGDECIQGRGDAAANVYVVWKRGLRWYSVKLVWSTVGKAGVTCRGPRNAFVATDSVILHSGPPTGEWREEEIDPAALYREHFEGGNPNAEVPELQGVGILTDGDQTRTSSAADYAGFVLFKRFTTAARR
jgi:DUF3047 family protein